MISYFDVRNDAEPVWDGVLLEPVQAGQVLEEVYASASGKTYWTVHASGRGVMALALATGSEGDMVKMTSRQHVVFLGAPSFSSLIAPEDHSDTLMIPGELLPGDKILLNPPESSTKEAFSFDQYFDPTTLGPPPQYLRLTIVARATPETDEPSRGQAILTQDAEQAAVTVGNPEPPVEADQRTKDVITLMRGLETGAIDPDAQKGRIARGYTIESE